MDLLFIERALPHRSSHGGMGWVVVLAAHTRSLLVSGFHSAFGGSMAALLDTSHSSISAGGSIMVSFYFTTKLSLATGIAMSGGATAALVQDQVQLCLTEVSIIMKG
ncbi:uncharacterized protein RDI95_000791 [Morus bassanus]